MPVLAVAAPGDRYEVRVKYFHPMHFDTSTGRYVLELPTVVPKVRVLCKTVLSAAESELHRICSLGIVALLQHCTEQLRH